MRLPRVRLTVWRMMVATAVIAIVLATWVEEERMRRRRVFYTTQAASVALLEANCKANQDRIAYMLSCVEQQRPTEKSAEVRETMIRSLRSDLSGMTAEVKYCARMRRKWEHAAAYPWLPVEPDPPRPR